MTRIESKSISVLKNTEAVFAFFSEMPNIGRIMPEQVEKFVSEGDTCHFTIKGMASLGLQFELKNPPSLIVMAHHGKAPFALKLMCEISPIDGEGSTVKLIMEADLNPFLKMVAEKPLTNFLNLLLDRYQSLEAGGDTTSL